MKKQMEAFFHDDVFGYYKTVFRVMHLYIRVAFENIVSEAQYEKRFIFCAPEKAGHCLPFVEDASALSCFPIEIWEGFWAFDETAWRLHIWR